MKMISAETAPCAVSYYAIRWILLYLTAVVLPLACAGQSTRAAPQVVFDANEYFVSGPGETFDVEIYFDGNDVTDVFEPARGGLFSFGTEIVFASDKAMVAGPGSIVTAGELDHFGFASGAFLDVSPTSAGSKGNIHQHDNPPVPYDGGFLMRVTLINQASPIDSYPLELRLFRTLGDTEQVFVTGSGDVLDEQISLGSAVVHVIPEPASAVHGLLCLLMALFSRRLRLRFL